MNKIWSMKTKNLSCFRQQGNRSILDRIRVLSRENRKYFLKSKTSFTVRKLISLTWELNQVCWSCWKILFLLVSHSPNAIQMGEADFLQLFFFFCVQRLQINILNHAHFTKKQEWDRRGGETVKRGRVRQKMGETDRMEREGDWRSSVPEGVYLLFSRSCQPVPSEWL